MIKSDSIKNIAEALKKFQKEVKSVSKDGANPFFKSKYATFDNIITTVRTPMVKHGLSFVQMPEGENELTTLLMHTSGEFLCATAKMTPKDSTPQAQGSAITYLKRYALTALLGISTDDDDDGNAASKKREVYDDSPIPEDVMPIVSYDQDAPVKETVMPPHPFKKTPTVKSLTNDLKKKIKVLADERCIVQLEKGEYEDWIKQTVGLDLTDQSERNLKTIIERLEALR